MSEFVAIETQEDFNEAIKKRLDQKEREVTARYEGWISPDDVAKLKGEFEKSLQESAQKLADSDKTLADLNARASKAEHALLRQQVAASKGIPINLADRLVGETKETLEKDAENFAAYLTPKTAPPMRSTEPQTVDPKVSAWNQMLSGLTNTQ